MNGTFANAGRRLLKDLLAQLKPENHRMFKLMYGRNGGKRSVADAEAMDINDVIDEMDEYRISTAIDQCERTIEKAKKATGG